MRESRLLQPARHSLAAEPSPSNIFSILSQLSASREGIEPPNSYLQSDALLDRPRLLREGNIPRTRSSYSFSLGRGERISMSYSRLRDLLFESYHTGHWGAVIISRYSHDGKTKYPPTRLKTHKEGKRKRKGEKRHQKDRRKTNIKTDKKRQKDRQM